MKKTVNKASALIIALSLALTGCTAPAPAGVSESSAEASSKITETDIPEPESESDPESWIDRALYGIGDALHEETGSETIPSEEKTMTDDQNGGFKPDPNFVELEPDSADHPWKEKYNAKHPCRIVFLGDSLYEMGRESDSVPLRVWSNLMNEEFNCTVYNLAMGGTCAALRANETNKLELWDSRSLAGMVHLLNGDIDDHILDGYKTQEIYRSIGDLNSIDYFVVGYGTNDFLARNPIEREGIPYAHDPYGYRGAMYYAVETLMNSFPNARVLVCTPLYAQFYGEGGAYLGDAYSLNNGYGTLQDYIGVCHNVAVSAESLLLNGYDSVGINVGNAADYLMSDGVHLNAEGRQKYADAISKILLENNDGKG